MQMADRIVDQALARANEAMENRRFGEAAGICDDVLLGDPVTVDRHSHSEVVITDRQGDRATISYFGTGCGSQPSAALWRAALGGNIEWSLALMMQPENAKRL